MNRLASESFIDYMKDRGVDMEKLNKLLTECYENLYWNYIDLDKILIKEEEKKVTKELLELFVNLTNEEYTENLSKKFNSLQEGQAIYLKVDDVVILYDHLTYPNIIISKNRKCYLMQDFEVKDDNGYIRKFIHNMEYYLKKKTEEERMNIDEEYFNYLKKVIQLGTVRNRLLGDGFNSEEYTIKLINDIELLKKNTRVDSMFLDSYNKSIYVITKDILMEGEHDGKNFNTNLGQYTIQINLSNNTILISRYPKSSGYVHPHIDVNGNVCLGDYGEKISQLLATFDINLLIDTLIDFLESYNEDSVYENIYDFTGRLGITLFIDNEEENNEGQDNDKQEENNSEGNINQSEFDDYDE